MDQLPKNTIIGNPLYVPILDDNTGKLNLIPITTGIGLWVAAPPKRVLKEEYVTTIFGKPIYIFKGDLVSYFEGSLYFLDDIETFNIFCFESYHATVYPTSIDNLVDEGFVLPTTYQEFFQMHDYHKLDGEIVQIPSNSQSIYYITEKGDQRIIMNVEGKPNRSQSMKSSLFDFLAPIFSRT